jgi:recombinational DNA repair ATPase RecF
MRLDKVYIDGFKNLKQLEVGFDEAPLTTVLIGQNGAGKSNLIEAIAQVFRWVDSLLGHFREPWFAKSKKAAARVPESPWAMTCSARN